MRSLLALAILAAAPALAAPPLAAQQRDRWQITLRDGGYLYELRPLALRGDSLVVEQEGLQRALALGDIHELREIRPSLQPAGTRRATFPSLVGADDRVFLVGYLDPANRRAVIAALLESRAAPRAGSGTRTIWGAP